VRTWAWLLLALGVALTAGWIVSSVHGRADAARLEQVSLAHVATETQRMSLLASMAQTDPGSVPESLAQIETIRSHVTRDFDRLAGRHPEIDDRIRLSRAAFDRFRETVTETIASAAASSTAPENQDLRPVVITRVAFVESLAPLDTHLAAEARDENQLANRVSIVAMVAMVASVAGLSRRAHRAHEARATWEASHQAIAASEARFRSLIEHAADLVLVIDDSGVVRDAGGSIERILGIPRSDTIGTALQSLIHQDDLPRFADCLKEVVQSTEPCSAEVRLSDGGGPWRWVELAATDRRADPLIEGIVLNGREVTERRAAEAAVLEREAEIKAVFNAAAAGIIVLDRKGIVRRANMAAERIFDLPNDEIVGRANTDPRWGMMREDGTPLSFSETPSQDAIQTRSAITDVVVGLHRPDGSLVWLASNARPMLDPTDGAIGGAVVSFIDITERKSLEDRLRHESLHDPLTGLANRVLFMEQLKQAIARAARQATSVATMFIDLDGFKEINDRLGHEAGDHALIEVASRLRQSVRVGDTIARFGGDEFGLILEGVLVPDEVVRAAERIITTLSTPYIVDGATVSLSASVGIAVTGEADTDPTRLLRDADVALYRAKATGKGRYILLAPLPAEDPDQKTSAHSTPPAPPSPLENQVR
jgi:diguanylate cyclase (GGDEF)-like protein/PAS domain S-box-containing protein